MTGRFLLVLLIVAGPATAQAPRISGGYGAARSNIVDPRQVGISGISDRRVSNDRTKCLKKEPAGREACRAFDEKQAGRPTGSAGK